MKSLFINAFEVETGGGKYSPSSYYILLRKTMFIRVFIIKFLMKIKKELAATFIESFQIKRFDKEI